MNGTIVRVNEYGLCEVRVEGPSGGIRKIFTLNQLDGYRGQPVRKFGVCRGAVVKLEEGNDGRVRSARLLDAAAHS